MTLVCSDCMQAIESHNGRQRKIIDIDAIPDDAIHYGYYDLNGEYVEDTEWEDGRSEECCECEWCHEMILLEDVILWD